MTPRAKAKQAKHNAEKDAKRRRITVAEAEQIEANLRKQEAEANAELNQHVADLNDVFDTWRAQWNLYAVPRLSTAFYYQAYRIVRKYLTISAAEAFLAEFSEAMQDGINHAAGDGDEYFENVRRELSEAGIDVPEWATEEDFEVVKQMMRNGRVV